MTDIRETELQPHNESSKMGRDPVERTIPSSRVLIKESVLPSQDGLYQMDPDYVERTIPSR